MLELTKKEKLEQKKYMKQVMKYEEGRKEFVKKQIADEIKSAKEYDSYGFDLIAADERKHAIWLKNALHRMI
jgi:hypothetical protein